MKREVDELIKALEIHGKQVEATFYEYQQGTKKVLTGSHYKMDLETNSLVSTSSTRLMIDGLYDNLYDEGLGSINKQIVFSKPKLILPRVRDWDTEYTGSYQPSPIIMADGKQIVNYCIGGKVLGIQVPHGWSATINEPYQIIELNREDSQKQIGQATKMIFDFFLRNDEVYISCTEYDDLGDPLKTVSGNATVLYLSEDENDMISTRYASINFEDGLRTFQIVYDEPFYRQESMMSIEDMYLTREFRGNVYQHKISVRDRIDGHEILVYPLYAAPEDPEYLTMFDIKKGYLPDFFMKESVSYFNEHDNDSYKKYGPYEYYERIIYKVSDEFKKEFARFTEIDKPLG